MLFIDTNDLPTLKFISQFYMFSINAIFHCQQPLASLPWWQIIHIHRIERAGKMSTVVVKVIDKFIGINLFLCSKYMINIQQ